MTTAEVRLWTRLRRWQVDGYRFRRQVPRGPYILDFACLAARLVVEVDGGQHAKAVDGDQERTAWLESRGFKVLRFWNNDVLKESEGVLETIRAALAGTISATSAQSEANFEAEDYPSPTPPQMGRGEFV